MRKKICIELTCDFAGLMGRYIELVGEKSRFSCKYLNKWHFWKGNR